MKESGDENIINPNQNALQNIVNDIEEIKGIALKNSYGDICQKIEELKEALNYALEIDVKRREFFLQNENNLGNVRKKLCFPGEEVTYALNFNIEEEVFYDPDPRKDWLEVGAEVEEGPSNNFEIDGAEQFDATAWWAAGKAALF